MTKLTRRRIELFLIGLAIFVAGGAFAIRVLTGQFMLTGNPEAQSLKSRYGPSKNSEGAEEWIIKDFFGSKREGVFVDVGASDYRRFSNTYYLEMERGWSGVAIDPLKDFEADYLKYRPRTRFRPFFISDQSNEKAKLYILKGNTLVSSSNKSFTEGYGKAITEIESPTITLNDLLDTEKISALDFMSMDIELAEPKALAGFDVERFRPALVCVEAHPEVRQQILDYFARHGYSVLGRYLRADTRNLWFAPLAAATKP